MSKPQRKNRSKEETGCRKKKGCRETSETRQIQFPAVRRALPARRIRTRQQR